MARPTRLGRGEVASMARDTTQLGGFVLIALLASVGIGCASAVTMPIPLGVSAPKARPEPVVPERAHPDAVAVATRP